MAEGGFNSFRENFLTCSICLEDYVVPRQLPCLHIFCHGCLEEMVSFNPPQIFQQRPAAGRSITCPICKKEHSVPAQGVSAFPHDFRTQSMLDMQEDAPSPTNLLYPSLGKGQNTPLVPSCPSSLEETDMKIRPPDGVQQNLEKQLHEHMIQLQRDQENLQKASSGLQEIDSVYDLVYQRIQQRDHLICQKIHLLSENLKAAAQTEHLKSKENLQETVMNLENKIVSSQKEEQLAREIIHGFDHSQMVEYSRNHRLQHCTNSENVNLNGTWNAPNLILRSNVVLDDNVDTYINPLIGSMCVIQEKFGYSTRKAEEELLNGTVQTAVFPFDKRKSAGKRVVYIDSVAKWKNEHTFSGYCAVSTDDVTLCQYNDMSLMIRNGNNGSVIWKSRQEQLSGLFSFVGSIFGTSQPSDAINLMVQGSEYVAVSYPHQFEIKLFKKTDNRWHSELKEHSVAYKSDSYKPDKMESCGNELVFLEFSGPSAQLGMYQKKIHILNTRILPFQYVKVINPAMSVDNFCIQPVSAYNRLYFLVSGSNVVAIDDKGNKYWSIPISDARGVCADNKGYLYVTSNSGSDSASVRNPACLHVLWHDGTLIYSYPRNSLNIPQPSRIRFNQESQKLIVKDGQQNIGLLKVQYA